MEASYPRTQRRDLRHAHDTLSVTAAPCQLSQGESSLRGVLLLRRGVPPRRELPLWGSCRRRRLRGRHQRRGPQDFQSFVADGSVNLTSTTVPTSSGVPGSTLWLKTEPLSPTPVAFRYSPAPSMAVFA